MKEKKPKKQTVQYYDYDECRDYLEKKYDYKERNYAKTKFTKVSGKAHEASYCERL